jgi:hypothetical protein
MPDYVYRDARSIYPDERTPGAVKRPHLRLDVGLLVCRESDLLRCTNIYLNARWAGRPERRHRRDESTGDGSAQASILPRCTSIYLNARMLGAPGS